MNLVFDWHLWMLPLFEIFEVVFAKNKFIYSSEHGELNSKVNQSIADDYRASIFFCILLFLPFVLIAGNRSYWLGDTSAYLRFHESLPSSMSDFAFLEKEKYPGLRVFTVLIKQFISTDFRVWLYIIASISVIPLLITYRKYSSEIVFSAFCFFTADFIGWMNNGCRQFMVAAILFALAPMLLKRAISKYFIFVLFGLFLFSFHVSVLVALPLFFVALGKPINKKTIFFIILIIIAIVFVNQFSGLITDTLENTAYEKSSSEIANTTAGTNIIRVLFFSVPAILAIFNRKKITQDTPPIIAYSVNMSMIGSAFYVLSAFMNGITIGRMPIYFTLFNYILIPWEIRHFFKPENQKIVFIVFIVSYFVFYAFQMWTWGIGFNNG